MPEACSAFALPTSYVTLLYLRITLDSTRYYESVAKLLHEAGLYVSAVNPLLIKEYGNNSLRKVKTDKVDAMKIAKYALDNWCELRDYTPMDTIRYDLKTLNRQFQLASKQKTATANNLIALQEQSFPGIRKLFDSPVRSDGTQKWVDFTHDFWHVDCVRSSSQNAFTERYRKWCKRNHYQLNMEKAAEVYEHCARHRTNREIIALAAIRPRNAALRIYAKRCSTS